MSESKSLKIIYFIDEPVATPAQIEEATKFSGFVDESTYMKLELVNTKLLNPKEPLMEADGVAGNVPEAYKNYPTAKSLLEPSPKKKASKDVEPAVASAEAKG